MPLCQQPHHSRTLHKSVADSTLAADTPATHDINQRVFSLPCQRVLQSVSHSVIHSVSSSVSQSIRQTVRTTHQFAPPTHTAITAVTRIEASTCSHRKLQPREGVEPPSRRQASLDSQYNRRFPSPRIARQATDVSENRSAAPDKSQTSWVEQQMSAANKQSIQLPATQSDTQMQLLPHTVRQSMLPDKQCNRCKQCSTTILQAMLDDQGNLQARLDSQGTRCKQG